MASLLDSLIALGDRDTAARNDEHMSKVFAANPAFASQLYGARQQQQGIDQRARALKLDEQEALRTQQRRSALADLAKTIGGNPNISPVDALTQFAGISGDIDPLSDLYVAREKAKTGVDSPSNVREYQYYQSLDDAAKQDYLRVKRAQQNLDLGGSYGRVDPMTGGVVPLAEKTLAPADQPLNAAAKAGAMEGAKLDQQLAMEPQITSANKAAEITGSATAKKEVDAPRAVANADYIEKLLTEIRDHPGLSTSVGAKGLSGGLVGGWVVPGTDAADFKTRLDQIAGQQFLQAFETLKGGGAITEVEGTKAQNAIARMSTAQSEKAFIDAVNEFIGIVQAGKERATKGTSLEPSASSSAVSETPRQRLERLRLEKAARSK